MTANIQAPSARKRASKIQRDPLPIVLSEAETPPLDMDFSIEAKPAALAVVSNALPADIEEKKAHLLRVRHEMVQFRKFMDGLLFGYVGADVLISAVPVLGDLFTAGVKFYAFSLARDVRAPRMVQLKILGYTALDAILAVVPIVGDVVDVFVRSHAWSAEAIMQHIDSVVGDIDRVHLLVMAGSAGTGEVEWDKLRAKLF